jgi:hypothetical protein
MSHRTSIAAAIFVAVLGMMIADAVAWDDAKYIDLKGQWVRASGGMGRYDPTKPPARGQEPPLTPSIGASTAALQTGDRRTGRRSTYRCLSPGMPRIMRLLADGDRGEARGGILIAIFTTIAASTPMDATGPQMDLNPVAGYSIGRWIDRRAPAATTCCWSERAA